MGKKNGKAQGEPKLCGASLGYRYIDVAQQHVKEEGTLVTRALMLSLFSEEENFARWSDDTLRPWTDEDHEDAWIRLCSHEMAGQLVDLEELKETVAAHGLNAPVFADGSVLLMEPVVLSPEQTEQAKAAFDGADAFAIDPYAPKRNLRVDLTKAEIDSIREAREEGDLEIEQLQRELTETQEKAKSLKKRIEVLQEDGADAARRIRKGWELRMVPCEERRGVDTREDSPSFMKDGVVTRRLDTNEIVDWRELRRDELQGRLFDPEPEAPPSNDEASVTEPVAAQ